MRVNGGKKTLSAAKSFVTSAGEADSYVVSARKAGASAPTESNLYLMAKNTAGLATQGRFEGLGLAGNASAPMSLTDVAIDDAARLGPEGSGFQSMLEVVLPHFQIGVASVSMGLAKAAQPMIVGRVGTRKYEHAGGAALASIPRVQFLVAEITLAVNSGEAYLRETTVATQASAATTLTPSTSSIAAGSAASALRMPAASADEQGEGYHREAITQSECSCVACQTRAQSHAASVPPSSGATRHASPLQKARTASLASSQHHLSTAESHQMVWHRPIEYTRLIRH